jgi:predicted NUDIX family phosphoesterase
VELLYNPGYDIRYNNELFLDEILEYDADEVLKKRIQLHSGYNIRLAGLIYDDSTLFGRTHLGLLYVTRLCQAENVLTTKDGHYVSYFRNGELLQKADQFDNWSRIIIDHLTAL